MPPSWTIAKTSGTKPSCREALDSGPAQTGSYPASWLRASTTSRASWSPHQRLLGLEDVSPRRSIRLAKKMLNDFAVGPAVTDFTYSALDAKPLGGSASNRLVASITVFPSSPSTFSNAAATAPPGTASSTTSASETSPPSRPNELTSWPASFHRAPSPPPIFPLPIVAIFISSSSRRLALRFQRVYGHASMGWARLVSNQRPLACEASALP